MSLRVPSVCAIILTKDEERDLGACIDSLNGLVSQVFVIDSGSSDRTLEIARARSATVLEHPFQNYATQFNWALDQMPNEVEWVIRVDADERMTPELKDGLRCAIEKAPAQVSGFQVARRIHFLGKPVRHGDSYPVWLLRVWRNKLGRCEDTWMDEHVLLERGSTVCVSGDLIHEIPKNLTEWTAKHNWYATRECKDILDTLQSVEVTIIEGQAGRKRWLKQRIYLRMPLFWRAFVYWGYRYFVRLGILDGKVGLIYHFLHAFWYRFLVDAKLYELQRDQAPKRVEGGVP